MPGLATRARGGFAGQIFPPRRGVGAGQAPAQVSGTHAPPAARSAPLGADGPAPQDGQPDARARCPGNPRDHMKPRRRRWIFPRAHPAQSWASRAEALARRRCGAVQLHPSRPGSPGATNPMPQPCPRSSRRGGRPAGYLPSIKAVIGASATEAERPSTVHSSSAVMVSRRAVPITATSPSCAALKAARSR